MMSGARPLGSKSCGSRLRAVLAAALAVTVAWPDARAQPQPPAPGDEITWWHSIENRTDPASFRGFLFFFPNGTFAPLARLRAGGKMTLEASNYPYKLQVIPYVALHGQGMIATCAGFPKPGTFDWIVVVPSGAPEFDPGGPDGKKASFQALAALETCQFGLTIPAQQPGAYEVRYVSHEFTSDGSARTIARAEFFSN